MQLLAGGCLGSSFSAVGRCACNPFRGPELTHLSGGGMGSSWTCLLFQGRRGQRTANFRTSVRQEAPCWFPLGLRVARRPVAIFLTHSFSSDIRPRTGRSGSGRDPLEANTGNITASRVPALPPHVAPVSAGTSLGLPRSSGRGLLP